MVIVLLYLIYKNYIYIYYSHWINRSKEEDVHLQEYINRHGDTDESFAAVAKLMGNKRSLLHVKNRYRNVLQKGIKKGKVILLLQ